MIYALLFLCCINAVMFFYILDQREYVKELENEINELYKYLNDEIN